MSAIEMRSHPRCSGLQAQHDWQLGSLLLGLLVGVTGYLELRRALKHTAQSGRDWHRTHELRAAYRRAIARQRRNRPTVNFETDFSGG